MASGRLMLVVVDVGFQLSPSPRWRSPGGGTVRVGASGLLPVQDSGAMEGAGSAPQG